MMSEIKPLELYVDKNFLLAFFVNIQKIDERFSYDMQGFFFHLRNFNLITNYSSWEEMKEGQNLLLRCLINTKLPEMVLYGKDLSSESMMRKICFEEKGSAFKLFFVEKNFADLSEKSGYEFISTDNLNKRWEVYYSQREDSVMQVTNGDIPAKLKLDTWEKIKAFSHPLNSILIFDLYILSDKANEKMDDNLMPLLEKLLSNCQIEESLDLMIITEKISLKTLELYEKKIRTFIHKKTKVKNLNLSLVLHDKIFYPSELQGLSFRRTYTNYFVIKAEKGFNCFRQNGKAGKIQDVRFEFIFSRRNCNTIYRELSEIKTFVCKVPPSTPYDANNVRINYYPHKKNRLIN